MLTDDELAAVSRPGMLPMTPTWSRSAPADQALARHRARESLVARGLLRQGEEGRSSLHPDLRAVLVLREAAEAVVVALRTTAGGRDHWCAHVVEDVVLLEEVSPDGVHGFALGRLEDLPGLLVAAALPPDAADARTPAPATGDVGVLVTVLSVVRGGSPQRFSWWSGTGGTWQLTGSRGDRPRAVRADDARALLVAEARRLGALRR